MLKKRDGYLAKSCSVTEKNKWRATMLSIREGKMRSLYEDHNKYEDSDIRIYLEVVTISISLVLIITFNLVEQFLSVSDSRINQTLQKSHALREPHLFFLL